MIKKIVIGVAVVAFFFGATLFALNLLSPGGEVQKPVLAALPPLKEISRQSTVVAPISIALTAIRNSLEAAAPRDFATKQGGVLQQVMNNAVLDLTVNRSALQLSGRNDGLVVVVPLNGTAHIAGQLGANAGKVVGAVGDALGGLLGGNVGKQIGNLADRAIDQRTDFHGTVTVTSRPALTPAWRFDPNLTAQVNIDTYATIAGIKINLANEMQPAIQPLVNEQVNRLREQLRNDRSLEDGMRKQWVQLCRSIPLGGGSTGLPALYLELKPVRAIASQPRPDANAVALNIGVQAATRVTATQTKPDCPFPPTLDIVPAADRGRLEIGVPIDVPFTDVNKLLEAQLKGQKFSGGDAAPVDVEVLKGSVAAAGDRLLISLLVRAIERKSWFGFGANATIHVWGKPLLDEKQQILRLTDLSLAVESEAAFGLLGAAARAAMPYLQTALAQNAVVNLTPFLADARTKIDAALADLRKVQPGVTAETSVTSLRLVGIDFDSNTLRIITEAQGTVKVTVTELPKM